MSGLEDQIQALRLDYEERLDAASAKIFKLNEENDLLAEANEALLEENITLKAQLKELKDAKLNAAVDSLSLKEDAVPEDLLTPGNGVLPTIENAVVEQAHVMNILSVCGHCFNGNIIASGGADKFVKIHDWQSKQVVASFDTGAPVLALAFHPLEKYANYLLVSCMDGKTYVLQFLNDSLHLVQNFHDHTRQGNIRNIWLTSTFGFATAASDKTTHLYMLDESNTNITIQFKIAKSYYFNGTVEAITVVPSLPTSPELLVIAVRDDCYVHYVDCKTLVKTRVNMNVDGIEHVSYTIMDLQVSPSGMYLLAATDANRHFIVKVNSNVVLRSFYGHKAGPYSQPRAVWHSSEKYIISNTEGEGGLVMWCIASERIVERVKAHEKLLRDLWFGQDYLITASYDKSIRVWRN